MQVLKNLNNDDKFSHLIEHALACTFERNVEDLSYVSEIRFGTIDEKLNVRQMRPCLQQGKAWYEGCSNKATRKQSQKWAGEVCSYRSSTLSCIKQWVLN